MAYTRRTWANLGPPPISAGNLNALDKAVEDLKLERLRVKQDFGGKADGTDDIAAIQAAFNEAVAQSRGGIVDFEGYSWAVGATITVPDDLQKSVRMAGRGFGATPETGRPSVLKKLGNFDLFRARGTGAGSLNQLHGLGISDLVIDGGNFTGKLLDIPRNANGVLTRVRMISNADLAINGLQQFNCWWETIRAAGCGTGGIAGTPAILLDAATGTATNTVHIIGFEAETNAGSDIVIADAVNVYLSNYKFERSAGHAVHLKSGSRGVEMSGGSMNTQNANACLVADTGSGSFTVGQTRFSASDAPFENAHLVELLAGAGGVLVGSEFDGALTSHIKIAAAYGRATIGPNEHNPAETAILDQRAVPSGFLYDPALGILVPKPRTREMLRAEAEGVKAQAFHRSGIQGTTQMVDATVYYIPVGLYKGEVYTGVALHVQAAGATLTLSKVGVYDVNQVRRAISADRGTSWETAGTKQEPFTGSWTVPADGDYYIAIVCKGTTLPTLFRGSAQAAVAVGVGTGARPFTSQTGQTDLPDPAAFGTGNPVAFWVGLY